MSEPSVHDTTPPSERMLPDRPVSPRTSFRLRGRSFLAFALTPALPVAGWLAELDRYQQDSPKFFSGRPIVLNVSGVKLTRQELSALITELETRGIRLVGIEGAHPSWIGPGLPPLLEGGRGSSDAVDPLPPAKLRKSSKSEFTSLLVENPVRSGQTVFFPHGDVTVVGSVASGAEIVAGGSVHIYGVLRGRAMAGAGGHSAARIFCTKMEAEMLAIDGVYKLADEVEPELRSRPIQAWLERNAIRVGALD